jgi:hypothetical protein
MMKIIAIIVLVLSGSGNGHVLPKPADLSEVKRTINK